MLNILAEVIAGSLLPGNPVANMVFKAYSVQTLGQALWFLQDLKLGHYIKVPPRATLLGALWNFYVQSAAADWFPIVQLISTVLVTFVQIGVKQWIFTNVKDICSPTQSDFLTCPHSQVWYTASVIWYVSGVVFCIVTSEMGGEQGFDRSKSSIWHRDNISSSGVCIHHRRISSFAILALATALPAIMDTLGEYAPRTRWHVFYPAHDGHQLLVMVPRRIRVPVPDPPAQFCVVDQVQLCDECGIG